MPFHVQISGHGFSLKSAARYNLDEEAVTEQFVSAWEAGTPLVVGGHVFEPGEYRIQVREGAELDDAVINSLAAWMTVHDASSDVTDRFITTPPALRRTADEQDLPEPDPRRVAVIHGRDEAAREALFDLLRALDLHPLEWTELVRATGSGAPSNRSVVEQLFSLATAAVVLLTPDDEARLHPDLSPSRDPRGEGAWACQPRPNVLLEAGMSLAYRRDRTIFVEVGSVRLPSDLDGVNTVRLDGTAPPLHALATRLADAGCATATEGTSWLKTDPWAALEARARLPRQ